MFNVVQYRAEHLSFLVNDTFNAHIQEWIDNGYAKEMEREWRSGTIVVNGVVTLCGGVTDYWSGRAQLWTIFGEICKTNFLPTFRGIQKFLNGLPYRRLELCVPCGTSYESVARRRAELLGFKLEVDRAEKFLPNGGDAALYSMVRDNDFVPVFSMVEEKCHLIK